MVKAITRFKRYFIEFIVIVVGVSVSFIGEQWRQELNREKEYEALMEQARHEAAILLAYAKQAPYQDWNMWKYMADAPSKTTISTDSLFRLLTFLEVEIGLDKFAPALYQLSKNDLVPQNKAHQLQAITGLFEQSLAEHRKTRSLIQTQFYPVLDRHGLLREYIDFRASSPTQVVVATTRPGSTARFLSDPEAAICLRTLSIYHFNEANLIKELTVLLEEFANSPQ